VRRDLIDLLASPLTRAPFDLDVIRVAEPEIVEAFLISQDERTVYPIIAGVAVLPADLKTHLRLQGNVYRRSPINDPRLGRFLLGQAGTGYVVVPFDEVVGHYQDLAEDPPDGYDTERHPEDRALGALLAEVLGTGERSGSGLDVGSGVGRGVFTLLEHLSRALGIDRSIACVRRARNVAVTVEHFFLPAPKGSGLKEVPLDLSGLVRDGADFAVADAEALPVRDDAMDVVLLRSGDVSGAWSDPQRAADEARRVLKPGGLLIWHTDMESWLGVQSQAAQAPYAAARMP
jgi:uncharacterized protein YbaR (Trm112 family)